MTHRNDATRPRWVALVGALQALLACSGSEATIPGSTPESSMAAAPSADSNGASTGIAGSGGAFVATGGAPSVGGFQSATGGTLLSATGGVVAETGGSGIGGSTAGGALSSNGGAATAGEPSGGTSAAPSGGTSTGGVDSGDPAGGAATGGNGEPMGGDGSSGMGTGASPEGAGTGGLVGTGGIAGGAGTGGTSGLVGAGGNAGSAGTGGTAMGGFGTGGNATGGSTGLSPSITKQGESLIALSGLTVVSYGGYLNGESFQQDAIISHNGHQYAAFWNTNRHVVMARRKLPFGEWEKFDFTDYTNAADDAHNTISLGICPADGTLHLAFDHHGSDLHYRRSSPGLIASPETTPWTATSFSDVTSVLEGPSPVTLVTYPRFVTQPGGERLLLASRIGESGSGDEFLWEYHAAAGSWSALGKFVDGVTDSVNAYLHGLAYAPDSSRLHMAWCWRETPDATTNHDLFYAYSDDHGRTWQNGAGDLIATAGSSFISGDSPGAMVWGIRQNRGLINQEHMAIDSAGRVHVLLSHMPDAEADDANFTSARTKSEYFHYWREADGTWSRMGLGLPVIENFRAKLAIASSNNVYAVLPNLRIASASAASGYSDWALLDSVDSGRFFSDPLIDTNRLEIDDILTVFYPQASSENIWALDYAVE